MNGPPTSQIYNDNEHLKLEIQLRADEHRKEFEKVCKEFEKVDERRKELEKVCKELEKADERRSKQLERDQETVYYMPTGLKDCK